MTRLALIKRSRFYFLPLYIALLAGLLHGPSCFAQDQTYTFDLNQDNKKDTIVHTAADNSFTIKYSTGSKRIEKKINFFYGYGEGTANMSLGIKNGCLWFSIRFAPKYIDQDTLWFRYDKQKNDWLLIKMASYTFNTMDPRLISKTCHFALIKKIWLLHDRYERVQSLAADKKNRVNTKCTEKDES